MPSIVPAVLAHSEDEFDEKISNTEIRAIAPVFQVDILDGSMFNSTCWTDAHTASMFEPLPDIELHLMTEQPAQIAEEWKNQIPSVMRAIVHAEISGSLSEVINDIKRIGIEVGVAINPETDVENITDHLEHADMILVMGVHPGKSGQKFLGDNILKKIQTIRTRFLEKNIAVDGGITLKNAPSIIHAGANQLCVSSAIWKAPNPEEAYKALKNVK